MPTQPRRPFLSVSSTSNFQKLPELVRSFVSDRSKIRLHSFLVAFPLKSFSFSWEWISRVLLIVNQQQQHRIKLHWWISIHCRFCCLRLSCLLISSIMAAAPVSQQIKYKPNNMTPGMEFYLHKHTYLFMSVLCINTVSYYMYSTRPS